MKPKLFVMAPSETAKSVDIGILVVAKSLLWMRLLYIVVSFWLL